MPATTVIDIFPLWAVFALSLGIILLAAEIGYQIGRLRHRSQHEKEPTVAGIVAAELGLLAFLLAFTFGLAASRFESRRETLLNEANAIGTTWLRAKMLPDPQRTEAKRLLREYVDARITAVQEGKLDSGVRRSEELHDQLWNTAIAASEKDAHSIPTGLFIQSLNDVIDLHAKRLMVGIRSRIPPTVWLALYAVMLLSFGSLGYFGGLSGGSRSPVVLLVAITISIVIWMIVDLDRPHEGQLRISQQPMIELRNSMEEPKP
jgi:hypothetical protein